LVKGAKIGAIICNCGIFVDSGLHIAQVLLRWGLQQGCAVIPKTVHESYIGQYSEEALLSWQLSDADMEELNALEDGHKYCWNPGPIR